MSSELIYILLAAPLIGFLINAPQLKSKNVYIAGGVATLASAISFVCSIVLFSQLVGMPEETRRIATSLGTWIAVDAFKADFGFVVDSVSGILILVVTGVGTLIHLFSIGYMAHDERPTKYFAYLNLFLFNMLILVLGDNLLATFIGWEGVGLCSYLLIGYWHKDAAKAGAGMKAFVTNRIGDAGFLLGVFAIFVSLGTVTYSEILGRLPEVAEIGWNGPLTLACLFLFIGAAGKSAQLPLYVWLPDAMAGPTPVSALIHAATMVTAGVYLFIRLSPMLILAPNAMMVIAVIGALTALFAATIGLTQWDIKKVLAYSTVSQLGFMFLAVGVGAFGAALFHLVTHAFFKALMFLGSGSVIHAMDEEQDIRKMGGLAKSLPWTHLTFLCGWVAIIGAPPFAGFFSKDEILWNSVNSVHGHWALWFVGLVAAGCTAFYMTRLMCLTFWGASRVDSKKHPHESPVIMLIPLFVLGALSIVGGWFGIPHALGEILPFHPPNWLEHWLVGSVPKIATQNYGHLLEFSLMGMSVAVAGIMAWLAHHFYVRQPELPRQLAHRLGGFYTLVADKYRVDEFYEAALLSPVVQLAKGLWQYIDVNFIDKLTYLISDWIFSCGQTLRSLQNGNLQQYALYISLGVVGFVFFVMLG